MRTADVDILIVPGWSDSGPDHWQSRWARNMKTARRVEQDDWFKPERNAWVARILAAAEQATRPVMLVGHSLGVAAIVHAAPLFENVKVAGAFLVAPSDLDAIERWPTDEGQDWEEITATFRPMPMERLPFPAKVIGSSNDDFCSIERAQAFGAAWGADVSIVANAGHLNTASGHGPWPEGLLTFGTFLSTLQPT